MNELELFAGGGGGIYGSLLLGHTTVCAVEILDYNRRVLLQRQRDGVFPRFPIWDDVRTFDGRPWCGHVDVVSGGFPCQDISSAGKGAGIDGERSGMWKHMARVVCEARPEWVFVENSPMLVSRGLGTVLRDLAEIGFDAAWTVLSAAQVGAPHIRERIWICAHSNSVGWGRRSEEFRARNNLFQSSGLVGKSGAWKETAEQKARILGMDDGVACRMDRLKAIGNGQVPIVAATAFKQLSRFLTCAHNDKMLLKEIERL